MMGIYSKVVKGLISVQRYLYSCWNTISRVSLLVGLSNFIENLVE